MRWKAYAKMATPPSLGTGFMSKILGWFRTDKQEAPAANDAVRTAREPRLLGSVRLQL